jgi:protein-disulfide isomerase
MYGMGADAFRTCVNDPGAVLQSEQDVEVALASGVYGTPTFFINGEPVVGYHNYRFLKAKIDNALKDAKH